MSETPAAGETAAAIEPKVRSGLSEWLGREAHGSSIQLSRTEIIRLQKAIAEGRAPKPPVDGTKCWQSEDKGLRLHIRLYDSGRGIWFTNYDTPRRRGRSWKIGNAANLNTTVAEKAATQIQARVALGADPQEEREELRDRPRLTVRALCRQFFDEVHKNPKFSAKTERGYRNIEKNHLGALGDLMFDELVNRQNEIVTHVRRLSTEVSPHTASALRTMLGSTYKWAMTVYPDNIPRNPITGTWIPDYQVQKVGQALTMEQLGAIWRACETMEREAVPTYRGNALGGTLTESVQAKTPFVSAAEAAKLTGINQKDLLRMMHAGRIKGTLRPGGKGSGRKINRPHYLFTAEDIKQLSDTRFNAMRSVDLEYSVIVRLMILLGSRYSEMAMLRWSEVKPLENGVLHMRTLNADGSRRLKSNAGRNMDLTIYLPQLAIDLIKKIPERPGRDFLFGIGPRGLTENDIQKKKLDKIILKDEGAPIVHRSIGPDGKEREDHWVLHWLRHSFSTRVDEDLGADPRIIRAITNHLSKKQKDRIWGGENEPGQHQRYTHAKYPKHQHQVLTAWAQHVLDAAHRVERKDSTVVWNAFGTK